MKKSKIAVLVAMVVVLAFSLAACGGSDDKSSSDKTVYKVGTEPTFPPFDTTDESKLYVAVPQDNSTIKGVDDLTPDMKVAAQTGTTGANKVQELKDAGKIKEAVILDGLDTCMMKLINGDVAAVINDKPVTEAYMKKQPDKIKMVGEALNAENYGFAVQKGNKELLDKINAGLKNIKDDGTYDKLIDEWFNK